MLNRSGLSFSVSFCWIRKRIAAGAACIARDNNNVGVLSNNLESADVRPVC